MQNIYADTTGQKSPTDAISTVASINDFTNRNNAFTSNNSYARGDQNEDQAYGDFVISIPAGSTIDGIIVSLEGARFQCATSDNPRFKVQLSNPSLVGDPTGLGSFTSNVKTTSNIPTAETILTLGSSIDTWGLTYTSTQTANLWVLVTTLCDSNGDDIRLDHLTVEVYYTLPPPPDTTPPVLTILGSNPLNHTVSTPYVDAGATAIDNIDGDITANIIVTNGVNENVVGNYIVNYFIADLAGNNSTGNRTVYVINSTVIPPIPPPPSNSTTTPTGDSCNDCISPTLGADENNKEMVSGGFTYNNQTVDVLYFRTPFPQIGTNVGDNNTLTLKIYEDSGINNIRHIAVAFGLEKDRGFSENKAYVEINKDWKGNITIKVSGSISNVTYSTDTVPCGIVRANCLEFTLYHTFTEDVSGIVGTLLWDDKRNSGNNYFNHGIIIKDNKVVIEEVIPEKIHEDKLRGITSFGYFERKSFAFDNYKQYMADEAKKLSDSLYGKISNWN